MMTKDEISEEKTDIGLNVQDLVKLVVKKTQFCEGFGLR